MVIMVVKKPMHKKYPKKLSKSLYKKRLRQKKMSSWNNKFKKMMKM